MPPQTFIIRSYKGYTESRQAEAGEAGQLTQVRGELVDDGHRPVGAGVERCVQARV